MGSGDSAAKKDAGIVEEYLIRRSLQYVVDRPFISDSATINALLVPIFKKFYGRSIFQIDADLLARESSRWTTGGGAPTMPFNRVQGISRAYAELCPSVSSTPRDKVGVVDFGGVPPETRLEILSELRFSLGAQGGYPIEGARCGGKFVPVVVENREMLLRWLASVSPKPFPPTLFFSKESLDWVHSAEVDAEVRRLRDMEFVYFGGSPHGRLT